MSKIKLIQKKLIGLAWAFVLSFIFSLVLIPDAQAVIPPDPGPLSATTYPACQKFVDTEKDPEGLKVKDCVANTPKDCLNTDRSTDKGEKQFRDCLAQYAVSEANPIIKRINTIVKFLSGLVAVVITGVIILGGIQYSMAGDKAEAVTAAKKRIYNALIALVVFILMFTFLQWLIPGGIFNSKTP
ncbi:TPA: hypothetical protein DIS56_03535 [Candidatus Saccharibacteria bacterium]|nr:MAG: hypothetical protein UX30_C0003G0023 [Candidatus Saccharibacteria bacterium GW2011_GWA2_46_10]OGL36375.1 MAG: hypothetical protein A3F05_01345 [Candidatus Saccharibacteria bacterium RIFCSPHIGHO2_12_FULL_47_17]HCM52172.1 hypothetical protein [Candidatus Saccharibacteria bacterium]